VNRRCSAAACVAMDDGTRGALLLLNDRLSVIRLMPYIHRMILHVIYDIQEILDARNSPFWVSKRPPWEVMVAAVEAKLAALDTSTQLMMAFGEVVPIFRPKWAIRGGPRRRT
jgi:hypothetical protein